MRMDSTSGLTFQAMQKAGKSNPQIAARVKFFEHRVLEEFYDFKKDPGALDNLISDPKFRKEIKRMRGVLENRMQKTRDPALTAFQNREKPEAIDTFMKQRRLETKKQN